MTSAACICPNKDTLIGNCPVHGARLTFAPMRGLEGGPKYLTEQGMKAVARRAVRLLRGS